MEDGFAFMIVLVMTVLGLTVLPALLSSFEASDRTKEKIECLINAYQPERQSDSRENEEKTRRLKAQIQTLCPNAKVLVIRAFEEVIDVENTWYASLQQNNTKRQELLYITVLDVSQNRWLLSRIKEVFD